MVAFSLPTNSKVHEGRIWPAPKGANLRTLRVYRWSPDDGAIPRIRPRRSPT